jgi:sensor histidine kinase YesM
MQAVEMICPETIQCVILYVAIYPGNYPEVVIIQMNMSRIPGVILYSEKLVYRITRHLFLFLGMNLLFTWVVYMRSGQEQQIPQIAQNVLINSLFFFGYAYLTAYVLVPVMLSKGRYLLFGVVFLFAGISISWLKFIFSDYLFYNAIGNDFTSRIEAANLARVLVNTKDMTFIVALFLVAKYAKDNHHVNKRLAMLQDDQLRSEIRLLRNQLDPHVVFNNLNNLYCLSLNQSPDVSVNLGRLSSLLSFYFEDGKKEKVKLRRELEAISDYLDLERLRYGDRLSIDFRTEGDPGEMEIYPLVLFPFIENCLEHGSSDASGEAWIRIRVQVDADSISFHASNSKPETVLEAYRSGNGQRKSRPAEKLDLLYPGRYVLRVDDRKALYSVDFKLKP